MEILYVESAIGFRILCIVVCLALLIFSCTIIFCLYTTELDCIPDLAKLLMFFAIIICAFVFYHLSETGIKDKIYVRFTDPIIDIEEFYEEYEIIDKKGEDIYVLISKK